MIRGDKQMGFTMVELLVVLTILALLAALVGPVLYQRVKPARHTVAATQIDLLMGALDQYFIDAGDFPSSAQGLQALRKNPGLPAGKWKGSYLKKEVPLDPWGRPYHYRAPGRSGGYELYSLGADGKEGGEGDDADVTSWK